MISVSVAAYLIFGTWVRPNGAQYIVAIPFAEFGWCERHIEPKLAELIADQDERPITIKPYCTTAAPAWWVRATNQM